jgi:palmitoyltransferase
MKEEKEEGWGAYFVTVFGLSLLVISFLYILVCVDPSKNTCLAKVKHTLCLKLPRKCCRAGIDNAVTKIVFRVFKFVCYRRNPIIQVLYLVLAVGGFYYYWVVGFAMLPAPYVPEWTRYTGTALMFVCYYSYFKACTVCPGKLTSQERADTALKVFEHDMVLFEAGHICKTCKFEKPARSKHCVVCDICVEKLDHHCIWINNCVGLRNYKYFLTFLLTHALLTTYGWVSGYFLLTNAVSQGKIRIRKWNNYDWYDRMIAVLNREPIFVGLCLMCFIISIMVFGFWAYHLWLISKGNSTNEYMKRA